MIINRSLLATIGFGTESAVLDADPAETPLTEEEREQAEVVEENANILDTEIQALEDLEKIESVMEEQVLQNEVNLASLQSEEVPAEGENISVTDQAEVVTNEGDVVQQDEVIAEGQAPAATLTPDSSVDEIRQETDEVRQGLESMSMLLSSSRAFASDGLMSIKNKSVKRHSVVDVGIESIINSPVQAYKQACLNYTVGLCSVKETIVNFFKSLFEKVKEFFSNLSIMEKMVLSRASKVAEKFKSVDLNTANINVNGNGGFLTYFNHGGIEGFASAVLAITKTLEGSTSSSSGLTTLDKVINIRDQLNNIMTNTYVSKLYQDLVKYGMIEEVSYETPCAIPTSPNTVVVFGYNKENSSHEFTKVVLSHEAENQMISNEQGAKALLGSIQSDCARIVANGKNAYNGIRNIKKSMDALAKTWEEMYSKSLNDKEPGDAVHSIQLMKLCKFGTRFMFYASRTYPTFVKCTEIALSWVKSGNSTEGQPSSIEVTPAQ